MKHLFSPMRILLVLLAVALVHPACNKGPKEPPVIDPAFTAHVAGFTSGIISNAATIKIRFVNPVPNAVAEEAAKGLFGFRPGIKGGAYWVDDRTVEFRPAAPLPAGQVYDGVFRIGKVIDLPKELQEFPFQVQVMEQYVDLQLDGLKPVAPSDMRWYALSGSLQLADRAAAAEVEKILEVSGLPGKPTLRWQHNDATNSHGFVLDSIQRTDKAFELLLKWNGRPIGVDRNGESTVRVPAFGDLEVLQVIASQYPEQHIRVLFSDPLDDRQDLRGLVGLKNHNDPRLSINLNEVVIHPAQKIFGEVTVEVRKGIKNILGFPFPKDHMAKVTFVELDPQIRLLGNGVIIPQSEGLQFPFEAVNLHAVQVKITKVFETNVAQFLQVNDLDGGQELRRVGRVVYNKKVDLRSDRPIDRGNWNRFSLKLDELIRTEPGAIYRVELSMKQAFSSLRCNANAKDDGLTEVETSDDDDAPDSHNDYDYYYDDYWDSGRDFKWSERDDPCKSSYYQYYGRKKVRNVLASDLGIIAKSEATGEMHLILSDLRTAQPLSGVQVEVLNYQQQTIGKAATDGNGFAVIDPSGKPFLVVAKSGPQRGYLRVDDGSALSVSMFQVEGQTNRKGVKGMIYGERGVWRPGDTLFLSFMLFDRESVIPANHPVVMELHDSKGNLHTRTVRTSSVNDLYNFTTLTRTEDPTGNWTATVKAGGSEFSKTIKIETIKPNRLKILMEYPGKVISKRTGQQVKMNVKWLHGAIAKGMKATVDMTIAQAKEPFPAYKGYTFDDPTRYFYSEESRVFEGKTDDGGLSRFDLGIKVQDNAPGMLLAGFSVKVFEPGGDFSIDRDKMFYSPYEGYVGFKVPEGKGWRGSLNSNQSNPISIVSVDADGRPVSREGVQVEVYRLDWRWWWEGDDDGLSRYVNNASSSRISNAVVNTVNGKAVYNLDISKNFWGRIMVRVVDPVTGHSAAQVIRMTYDGWLANMGEEGAKGATMLMFDLDRDTYKVGEEVKFSIPSTAGGRALVSLENGSSIVGLTWVDLKDGQTPISFTVTKDMAPTVYAHISLIQPHGQTVNDLPIRLYGIQPITVVDEQTVLKPVLDLPAELRPEQKYEVKVSEATGRPMTYTLAIVDEGLLDLTKFKTPDPHSQFYAKDALGVRSWDLYDLVLGARAGELAGLLAIGGDEYNRPKGGKKAERFKPVVTYLGPFYLEKGKKATHSITMPNYIGSVRAMVVAGQDLAYGSAEKTVPVRKPLMVLSTLPRVLGPGERVKLPVTVFAMDTKVKQVEVKVSVSGPIQIEGSASQKVIFKEIGEEVVYFDLVIPETIGIAKVKVEVTSGSEKAEHSTELDVRLGNPPVREVVAAVIEPGQEAELAYSPPGMAGTNTGVLEVSSIPPLNLRQRMDYLLGYPHGCVEQTVSGVFPQLAVGRLVKLSDKEQATVSTNVKAGIQRLRLFQLGNGGMSYWPGDQGEASAWGTTYAGHFLLEAKNKGYTIPHGMLDNWKKYQAKTAREWNPPAKDSRNTSSELEQAYRLYTLALAGSPEIGAMNRMMERGLSTVQAAYRLAAAYHLAGRTDIATRLIDGRSTDIKPYKEMAGSYGSDVRDLAMILETLHLVGRKKEAFVMMQDLAKRLGSDNWYSTQTTAYTLMAIARFAGDDKDSGLRFDYTASTGKKGNMSYDMPVGQVDLALKGKQNGTVNVKNTSASPLYARVILSGIPVTGDQSATQSAMTMSISYTDLSGKPLDPTKLAQGTDFMAEVTVRHTDQRDGYQNMALSQVFPSGWEVVNMRITDDTGPVSSPFDFQDIRDDRVYTYFGLPMANTRTYRTLLNASYAGRFYLPTVYCEAMYDNEVMARLPGKWVEVSVAP